MLSKSSISQCTTHPITIIVRARPAWVVSIPRDIFLFRKKQQKAVICIALHSGLAVYLHFFGNSCFHFSGVLCLGFIPWLGIRVHS